MENKIRRFLKLSVEFTVESDEVYEGFIENIGNNILTYGSCHINSALTYQIDSCKTPTKLEQFTNSHQEKIKKAERYEEYLKLQKDLLEYYTAKEKLNN